MFKFMKSLFKSSKETEFEHMKAEHGGVLVGKLTKEEIDSMLESVSDFGNDNICAKEEAFQNFRNEYMSGVNGEIFAIAENELIQNTSVLFDLTTEAVLAKIKNYPEERLPSFFKAVRLSALINQSRNENLPLIERLVAAKALGHYHWKDMSNEDIEAHIKVISDSDCAKVDSNSNNETVSSDNSTWPNGPWKNMSQDQLIEHIKNLGSSGY